jgi:hypothetical protein
MSITFPPPTNCIFTLAEAALGISIEYELVLENEVPDVVPHSQQSCPGPPGASQLYLFERLSGGNESYCICDNGLCPAPPDTPITLHPGTYPGVFEWDGKNWNGPSDTGNPKGPPFPPGEYTLDVSTTGLVAGQAFEVRGTLNVKLIP